MKKLALAMLLAVAGTVAAPVALASADEPIECKIVNNLSQKLAGEDWLICIDDPNDPPSPF